MTRKRIEVSREQLEWAVQQTNSARAASDTLGIAYTTFIRRCKEFGVYKPNQGLKGTSKPNPRARIPLEKIFANEHFMTGAAIKRKMIAACYWKDECHLCGLQPVWNGFRLVMQVDHIDGDKTNNAQSNLRLLCPNCHTQTHTFSKGKFRSNASVA